MSRRFAPRALRGARRVCQVLDLYTFPVQGAWSPADPARSLEDATAPVLSQMREAYPDDLDARKYDILVDRLADPGDRTLVIRDEDGEPCGYCHITLADTTDERIRYAVRLQLHQAYLWDDRVFAAHRRRGLHAYSIARRLELIAEAGRTEALTIISRSNLGSRTSYAAFGAVRQRALYYLPLCHRTVAVPSDRRHPGSASGAHAMDRD
ncbi:hypothetical protein FNH13_18800 [Ornithinimicrobium ciconiae]|uniref:N-acetyltransferase domain-containing protein n=1 Tax=Ornithinimicrobium ciconiae TaxID=2594265 RepID=A0A516GFK7_9MICO|nr:hypothetical protein [Ornithinimicrobium ciconiae]QDO90120.1 hypothetical protein FNH13_18800 [Ornithinimicrobium ciconiae]